MLNLSYETINIILTVTLLVAFLIILLLVYKSTIKPFQKRISDSENKLPNLDEVYKQKMWEVKTVHELKAYKRKNKNVKDVIKTEDSEEDIDLSTQFDFGTKRKITIRRLPEGLIELEKTIDDGLGDIQVQTYKFNKNEDKDFDDILGDLTSSIELSKIDKNVDINNIDKVLSEREESIKQSQQAMNEAFDKLEKLLAEKDGKEND